MPALTKRERSVAAKWRRYSRLREQAGELYDQADKLLNQIAKAMQPRGAKPTEHISKSGIVTQRFITRIGEDGLELHCIDNSQGDAVILGWGHAAVRRYELKTANP